MWCKLALFFVLVVVAMSQLTDEEKFRDFKVKFSKKYSSPEEEERRFNIFKDNLKHIEAHNDQYKAGQTSYTLGINDFTDMTQEEFSKTHLGFRGT